MLNFTIDIAQKTGKIILSEKKHMVIEKKSLREVVTNADIAAQKFINESITARFKDHDILGEESYDKKKDYSLSKNLWLVDPIDGTTNFTQGLSEYCVSIGYYENKKPILGVAYFPEKNMLFTAESGKGAFLNGNLIHVASKENMKDVVFSGLFSYQTDINLTIFDISKKLYQKVKTMRFMGSAVLDLCFTACGFLDGTFGLSLKPWDMAAGYLIAKEAGAVITRMKGEKWDVFQPQILAANPSLHPKFVELFTRFLP